MESRRSVGFRMSLTYRRDPAAAATIATGAGGSSRRLLLRPASREQREEHGYSEL